MLSLLDQLVQFYRGRRVLVTGHTGFKGAWLSVWLKSLGADVTGFSLPAATEPNLSVAAELSSKINHIEGDIRNPDALSEAFTLYQPEYVFHLAAQPIVRTSYKDPLDTYTTNIIGVANLLECVRRTDSVKAVVNVTTDKVYENKEWDWGYRENEPLGGYDPYSASKACSEIVTSSYRRSFFGNKGNGKLLASARAGNVIGGGDWSADRIICDCVRAIVAGKEIEIRNPQSTRPWQHVLEPLSGYLWLMKHLAEKGEQFAEAWNFGPREYEAKPVIKIVEEFISGWKGSYIINQDPNAPHEAKFLELDCHKAYHRLGWKATLYVDEAIKMTVNWYKAFYEGRNAYELCEEDIKLYSGLSTERNSMRFPGGN